MDNIKCFEMLSTLEYCARIDGDSLSVLLDKRMPQAMAYLYKDGCITGTGNVADQENYYLINGEKKVPEVIFERVDGSRAKYTVKTETLEFAYEYSIRENTLVKKMLYLNGDCDKNELWIEENNPIFYVDSTIPQAGVAASNTSTKPGCGPVGAEMSGYLDSMVGDTIKDCGFVFVWNSKVAATVYTPSAFYCPYSLEVVNGEDKTTGTVYSGKYYHRLKEGTRVEREDANGEINPVFYESIIGFADDVNNSGKVDWQDAALWLRKVVPQMPQKLKDYLKVGSWGQARFAFPGDVTLKDGIPGFTKIFGTYRQYLELQKRLRNLTDGLTRQTYCVVGWQGRGHDYGWPDLSEQPVNPVLGTSDTINMYKKLFDECGGDLSFHINQSDVDSHTSITFRRIPTIEHPFGNASIVSNTASIREAHWFGWPYWQNSHYYDFIKGYVTNRQNAFIDKYFAPFIMYQDVMTDRKVLGYGIIEDQYGKARQMQHWASFGINMATEVYSQEKFFNGQFLFLTSYGFNKIDSFVLAGNAQFAATRAFKTQKRDLVWGYIGNNSGSISRGGNRLVNSMAAKRLIVSFVNMGMLSQAELISFEENAERAVTVWSGGLTVEYSSFNDCITVKKNGKLIACDDNCCVPAPDSSKRAFVYNKIDARVTWDLPECLAECDKLSLYRLTANGRVFVDEITASNGRITFDALGENIYLLTSEKEMTSQKENLALLARLNASSRNSEEKNCKKVSYGAKLVAISKELAPTGRWTDTIFAVNSNMLDSEGNLLAEYPCSPNCTVDGDPDTYWEPNDDPEVAPIDMADGEAYLEYRFDSIKEVSQVVVNEVSLDDSRVTDFEIRYYNGSDWATAFKGKEIPGLPINFAALETEAIRFVITGAKGNVPRISNVEIY
ncbi:MAG: hypothetical protein IKD04_07825 [Clostridia bacterium]|nr:hypothetical protein [Clostridia bacterium]